MLRSLAILAAFMSFVQASSPVPRQASEIPAKASGKVENHPGDNKRHPGPSSAVNHDPATDKEDEGGEKGQTTQDTTVKIAEFPKVAVSVERDQYDRSYWVFSGLLVLVGGLQIVLLRRTWKTMDAQAKKAIEDAAASAVTTAATLKTIERQTTHLRRSAKAAYKSAHAAMGVAIPTLMIQDFEFIPKKDVPPYEDLEWPTVMISVKNYGQSPAIMRSFAVEFTCEELPSELLYPSLLHFDSGTAVETGKIFRLEECGVTSWRGLSAGDALAVANNQKTLTVYGCIWYDDIFGSPTRKLHFSKWGAEFMSAGNFAMWIDTDTRYGKEDQNPN
jgi:hypothetical protein